MQFHLTVFTVLALALAFGSSDAHPLRRADGTLTQTQTLQYALTLEHLEAAFYTSSLARFSADDFAHAGFPPWVRARVEQIAQHEQTHVTFLTTALGADAVAACDYNFPVTDASSFIALSQVLEGVGTSAYLGAAHFITDASVLTAAGAILTTEARHASWLTSSVSHLQPWSSSLDTPLTPTQVFTLASAFITSCPSSNPSLGLTPFPALTASGTPTPGAALPLSFTPSTGAPSAPLFVALFSGLSTKFLPLAVSSGAAPAVHGTVQLPADLQGTVYAVVTTSDTSADDGNIIAGPAVLDFPFLSTASNP